MKRIKTMISSIVMLATHAMLATSFLPSSVHAAPKATTAKVIQIFNQSTFTNSAITEYLLEHAPKSHIALLTDKRYVLHVFTDHGQFKDGTNFLVAKVGFTSPAPDGQNSRTTAYSLRTVSRLHKSGKLEEKELKEEQAQVLRGVLDDLLNEDPKTLLTGIELTYSNGGSYPSEPRDETKIQLTQDGLDREAVQKIIDLTPDRWSRQFDYREVTLTVSAFANTFNDKSALCWAIASVAARPPQERNTRISDFSIRGYYEMNAENFRKRGGREKCKEEAAVYAMQRFLENPLDQTGIFKSFLKTREAGVSLPNFSAVKRTVGEVQTANNRVPQPAANTQSRNCHYVRETVPELRFQEQCDWGTTGPTNCRQVPNTEWKSEDKLVCQ